MKKQLLLPDPDLAEAADAEIRKKQGEVKYDLRDFTVEFLIEQFKSGLFYVPNYQRQFIWTDKHRSRFIESVLLGLPIPMMFVADMDDGRLEIVDGAQRIRTLEDFTSGALILAELNKLPKLNGLNYDQLSLAQRRKFGNKALRIVVLDDSTSAETRQEIFDRVNTSGLKAKSSEVRRGAHQGAFMKFITECANDKTLLRLCPISKGLMDRYENEELVLRYFAYADEYKKFQHDVDDFLTKYLKVRSTKFNRKRMEREFKDMLKFVEAYFPYGFAKSRDAKATPRVRFEAISVGVTLALRFNSNLVPLGVSKWIESRDFEKQTTTHASNSLPRLTARVEFVRDHLLGGP